MRFHFYNCLRFNQIKEMSTILDQINKTIFIHINHYAGTNALFDKITIITASYLPIIFILILIYLWLKNKEYRPSILFCIYSAIVGLLLNYFITLFYFHPRPFMDKIGTILIYHVPETSFPSDHTTFMASIALMLLFFKRIQKIGILLVALALIGGMARVFAGIHYPFDIVGSFLVAAIASSIVFSNRSRLLSVNEIIINRYSMIVDFTYHKFNKK